MERLATFLWRPVPPASIDEELSLYDDGSAWLAVRRPMTHTPTVGTYAFKPERAAFDELVKFGPGPVILEQLAPTEQRAAAVMDAARAVADGARAKPQATAAFYGRPMGAPVGGRLSIALQVVAAGERAVEFELDPGACAVHFSNFGQAAGSAKFPPLETGFVTPDAEGLGGLKRRAEIKPGDWGALVVTVDLPITPTAVALQVAGWLYEGLPDDKMGGRFELRTDEANIAPPA